MDVKSLENGGGGRQVVPVSGARVRAFLTAAFCIAAISAGDLCAQPKTDADGRFRSDAWIVVGPFEHALTCESGVLDLHRNYIAPSFVACEFPRIGDRLRLRPDRRGKLQLLRAARRWLFAALASLQRRNCRR